MRRLLLGLLGAAIPLLAALAAGHGATAPPSGAGTLRIDHRIACCYVEGARTTLRVVRPDGEVVATRRSGGDVAAALRLDAGRYAVETLERPCDGSCAALDPPTDRCRVAVEVAAGRTTTVTTRVAPGRGCRAAARS